VLSFDQVVSQNFQGGPKGPTFSEVAAGTNFPRDILALTARVVPIELAHLKANVKHADVHTDVQHTDVPPKSSPVKMRRLRYS
jgi:hypothetical protein